MQLLFHRGRYQLCSVWETEEVRLWLDGTTVLRVLCDRSKSEKSCIAENNQRQTLQAQRFFRTEKNQKMK